MLEKSNKSDFPYNAVPFQQKFWLLQFAVHFVNSFTHEKCQQKANAKYLKWNEMDFICSKCQFPLDFNKFQTYSGCHIVTSSMHLKGMHCFGAKQAILTFLYGTKVKIHCFTIQFWLESSDPKCNALRNIKRDVATAP